MELARPVQQDDLAICADLLTQAIEHTRTMRGGAVLTGPTTTAELLARWSTSSAGSHTLHVGLIDDAIVGLAAAVTFVRPEATTPSGLIECCYVEPDARGVGVGTALMDAVVAWCTNEGCRDVDALALPGDRATKQRLEAAGFTARLLTLSRRLD